MAKITNLMAYLKSRRPRTSYEKAAKQLALDILYLKSKKLGTKYDVSVANLNQSIGYPETWEKDGKIKDFIADAYIIYKPGISVKKLLYMANDYIYTAILKVNAESWER